MMEKFVEDAEEWERRHAETWLGRTFGDFGTAASAQTDLMSPLGLYDFSRDPSLFNLAKVGYNPAIAWGGYSLASLLSGTRIGFVERVMHSGDMARRTAITVGQSVRPVVVAAARRTPAAMIMAGIFAASYYFHHAYADWSGMYIGDLRYSR